MAENMRSEFLVETILTAIGNTGITANLVFENLELRVNSLRTNITLNGKVSVRIRLLQE